MNDPDAIEDHYREGSPDSLPTPDTAAPEPMTPAQILNRVYDRQLTIAEGIEQIQALRKADMEYVIGEAEPKPIDGLSSHARNVLQEQQRTRMNGRLGL